MTAEKPELAIEDQPKELELTDGPAPTATSDSKPVEGDFNLKEGEIVDPVDKVGSEDFKKEGKTDQDDKAVDGKFDLKENQIVDPVDQVGNEDFKEDDKAVDGKFDLKESEIVEPVDKVGNEDFDKKRPAAEEAASAPKKKKLAGKKSKSTTASPRMTRTTRTSCPKRRRIWRTNWTFWRTTMARAVSMTFLLLPRDETESPWTTWLPTRRWRRRSESPGRPVVCPEDVEEEEDYVEVQE